MKWRIKYDPHIYNPSSPSPGGYVLQYRVLFWWRTDGLNTPFGRNIEVYNSRKQALKALLHSNVKHITLVDEKKWR